MTDLAAAARDFILSPAYVDVTLRQIALLAIVVDEAGPHHVRDLALRLGVQKPVISRAVQRLSGLGLVARRRGDDKRDCLIVPTPQGRAWRRVAGTL